MAKDISLAIEQRDAEVTLNPQVDQPLVERKLLLDAERVVAEPSAHNILARGPGQVEFFVLAKLAFAPVCESPDARRNPGEFGDECVAHPDGRCEVTDQ